MKKLLAALVAGAFVMAQAPAVLAQDKAAPKAVAKAEEKKAEAKAKVDAAKNGLKDGSFVIWKGPIVGQDGKEVLAKDAVADDKFLGGIDFFVKGVEGKVPGKN